MASLDLGDELKVDDVCRALVCQAVDLTGSDAGCLYVFHPRQRALESAIIVGEQAIESLTEKGLETAEKVLENQEPLIVEHILDSDQSDTLAAIAAVPLRQDGQYLGVLETVVLSPAAFTQDDLNLLSRLTDQTAAIIGNAKLRGQTVLQTKHLSVINRIARAMGKTLDLEYLTQIVYREVKAVFELDAFFMALYDEETNELSYQLQIDDGTMAPPERKPLGDGLIASVIKEQKPLLIRDFENEQEDLPPAELWGTMKTPASWLGVPMQIADRTVGVICIQAYQPQAYGEIEQQLLTTIAEQVAIGVENAQLYEETSQRLAQTQVLRELMLAAASTLDFDLVLERTIEALHNTMGIEFIGFALPDRDRQSLRLHPSQIGFPVEAEKVTLGSDHSVCGRVFLTGEPMIIDDVRESPCYYQAVPETRSELAVPVGVHGQVAGVLNVESTQLNAFDEKDLDFYTTIASQLSVALENARLFQAERRQRHQTEALEEAAAIVSGTLNLDQVLDRILGQVEKVVDGDAFNIMLVEQEGQARVARRRGYESEDWGVESASITGYPLLMEMIQSGDPIAVPNTATDPRWVLEEGQESWESYVGAPIKVGGVVVGFLNVNSIRQGTFSQQDAQRLQAFANHAATALENAQLYHELHNYADALEERVEERTSQLRAQYAQLEAILESTTDGIVLAGTDGELVLANPVARDWLQHTLSPEESDQLREAVRALAMKADGNPEVVLELTGLDLQLTAAPVRKPEMEEARAVVAIHDVSHLKALNRMKSRFVANVSHELRTPIATIKLLAHLMQQQPEGWKEYLDPLVHEAEHQANLVRDILEISRVDAGRTEIRLEPTNLNDLAEMAMEKYNSRAQSHGLTLTSHLGQPDPVASADSKWMMQVLNNLLSNAIRYTPEGGTITISTSYSVANGRSWATLTVTDTGIGIPEEELPYIFDRFFRGEKPRTMQISGTGLGLALLKEIVELHGGKVTVESEIDKGSIFTVWLPRNPQG